LNIERLVKGLVAMGCLTTLEMTALILGVDGAYFAPVVAAIAAIGGYTIAKSTDGEKKT